MKTKVYPSYSAFLDRADKSENGVSESFAKLHPDYEKQNEKNERCWDCSDCYGCSDCSRCSRCYGCSDCSGCYGCSDCSDCYSLKNAKLSAPKEGKSWFDVPVIPNIHQTIFKAASEPGALNMRDWHTCDTTHCRAGWAVFLAGENGKKLEAASSTLFAAMQIYHASNPGIPVSPVRFFEKNEVAMADIVRCAELEAKAAKK